MVVMGAIRIPDMAPINVARVNVMPPEIVLLIPTSRAPRRFTAVARKARPYSVLPKNSHSARIRTSDVRTTNRPCADQVVTPRSTWPSTKAGVRHPSAPKKTRPRPTSTKCRATDVISNTSTLASASG